MCHFWLILLAYHLVFPHFLILDAQIQPDIRIQFLLFVRIIQGCGVVVNEVG